MINTLTIPEKMYEVSIYLKKHFAFYHEIFLSMNIKKDMTIQTMGVNITSEGANLYYNEDFVNSLSKEELLFVLIHEIFHILFRHPQRVGQRDKTISNIAQDMIINTMINRNLSLNIQKLNNNDILFIPKEYNDKEIFEYLYDWLLNTNSDKSNFSNTTNKILDGVNNLKGFDLHLEDEVSPEIKDQIVEELIDNAKKRGLVSGNEEIVINSLKKVKNNPLKEIKQTLMGMIGQKKYRTWSRPNRKELPLKGFRKYRNEINVIFDSSGSMSGIFDKTLSYLFENNIFVNFIQIDTEIQEIKKIKNKNELKKMKIKGLGGTTLQPAIDYIEKNFNIFPTLILTDGYTDRLDLYKLKNKVLILTFGQECPILSKRFLKQINIKD